MLGHRRALARCRQTPSAQRGSRRVGRVHPGPMSCSESTPDVAPRGGVLEEGACPLLPASASERSDGLLPCLGTVGLSTLVARPPAPSSVPAPPPPSLPPQ